MYMDSYDYSTEFELHELSISCDQFHIIHDAN